MTEHDDEGPADAGPSRVPELALERWHGDWAADDPFAGLKADVEAYGHLDPLRTVRGLSAASGIPVGALARYVLARWASGGNEALLELGVSGVDHLVRAIADAEEVGTDEARLQAYTAVRELISWLRAGSDERSTDPPSGP